MFFRRDKMNIVFFSSNMQTVNRWKKQHNIHESLSFYDSKMLKDELEKSNSTIVIADYDSIAPEINRWITSNSIPEMLIVLERVPEIVTGKSLISHGVKAYGNAKMLPNHFEQMLQAVENEQVWTYPALTTKLAQAKDVSKLSDDSKSLIRNRLSQKEKEVIYLILDGLVNDAIAKKLDITTRTVKAHIGSIFSKLHVNDRVSLILLLK